MVDLSDSEHALCCRELKQVIFPVSFKGLVEM